eukprot:GHRR01022891.1.p1 GENE.GHRR01022891.1~~GHRR01022891.1.p1  ORF type:complete len:264 (+),score=67.04 GHRR01022891.1:571-1362(+)
MAAAACHPHLIQQNNHKTSPSLHSVAGGTILGTSYDHHRVHRHASGYISASDGHSSNGYTTTSSYEESTAHNGGNSGAAADDQQSSDELEAILHKLEFWRINHFFVIGGQGGNQLAAQLAEGCKQRKVPCCIVGVPKSVDNDVMLVDKTFGFDTVVQEVVQRPLLAAKTEAASARKGVGLVKVFGRRSGWIALQASLASGVVDVCLIPEEPFEMQGPAGRHMTNKVNQCHRSLLLSSLSSICTYVAFNCVKHMCSISQWLCAL